MADEPAWLDLLGRWTYGVDPGGRVFFINDEEKSTSWVHPGTKSPIQSGYCSSPGLPRGWEMDSTREGAVYFIKERQRL
ncbi:pleckstrin homology domain-containing family A member 5-like isoform X2 [Myotis daubentonii]|uniref:pleckstrin homology domain-containing family A member 5-like isoform X2 n=1 Tax=Myotis daubentonii TaxID=98922 RepID=UPI002873B2FE|nr:pleckstrin homology domain-containing family A member 5-like isoform X2 [Myotis daubentonii]